MFPLLEDSRKQWGVPKKVGLLRWHGGEASPARARDTRDSGSTPGLGRSLGTGNDNLLSILFWKNSMDRGAWWASVQQASRVRHDWATEHTQTHPPNKVVKTRGWGGGVVWLVFCFLHLESCSCVGQRITAATKNASAKLNASSSKERKSQH